MVDISKTTVIITSALFADKKGHLLEHPQEIRIERLLKTLRSLKKFNFENVLVLDSTIRQYGTYISQLIEEQNITFNSPPINSLFSEKEYLLNGPSRLEIDLLYHSIPFLKDRLRNEKYIIKLSAGYEIKNLEKILAKAQGGLIYRFGNPLRMNTKLCLSCFYIFPVKKLFKSIEYCYANLEYVNKSKPLEAFLYEYAKLQKLSMLRSDYPIIDAQFMSSNTSSKDLSFKIKLFIYVIISKMGLYTFEIK